MVYADRMRRNLDNTKGLIFSGQLLLDLAAAGMLREDAYRLVQTHAMQAWRTDGDFQLSIQEDATVARYLSEANWRMRFRSDRQLKNVHAIFDRVFNSAMNCHPGNCVCVFLRFSYTL